MIDLKGRKVAVIGLSRSGLAAARMLYQCGARPLLSDVKTADQLKDELKLLAELDLDLEYELGGHGEKCLACELIVVSPGVPLDLPFFQQAAERDIPVIGEIELAYQFTKARIIAITGTNGKTTTTSLLGEILKKAGIGKVRVAGNIGTPLISEAAGLSENDWLVVEISSFQLETIKDFKPAISLYLNFTPDHLDRHKTVENYWLAKRRIFENQNENDLAIVNYDDQQVMEAVAGFPGQIYHVSLRKSVKQGTEIVEQKLIIKDAEKKIEIIDIKDIPLKGEHNLQNISFAALAAYLSGTSPEIIKETIQQFKAAKHRLQEVCLLEEDILVVDDSKATNPDAAIKALKSYDRPIVLIAGGQDRNADFTDWALALRQRVKYLVLLGETRFKMKEIALNNGFANINIQIADNMQQAVKFANQHLISGDCLMLSPACPSWDMYHSYQERGREFQEVFRDLRS